MNIFEILKFRIHRDANSQLQSSKCQVRLCKYIDVSTFLKNLECSTWEQHLRKFSSWRFRRKLVYWSTQITLTLRNLSQTAKSFWMLRALHIWRRWPSSRETYVICGRSQRTHFLSALLSAHSNVRFVIHLFCIWQRPKIFKKTEPIMKKRGSPERSKKGIKLQSRSFTKSALAINK